MTNENLNNQVNPNDENSGILDQVISDQRQANFHNFNPRETIARLFDILSQQEQEILRRRYALREAEIIKRQTLEEIGKFYGLTRERIRQIENRAIKKIRANQDFTSIVNPFGLVITQILEDFGGVMEEKHLLRELLQNSGLNPDDNFAKQATLFLIDKLIDETEKIAADNYFLPGWRTAAADLENFKKILDALHNFIESRGNPIHKDEIIAAFRASSQEMKDLAEKVIHSALEISSRVKTNPFGEWGFADWKSISPKRVGDKILIALEKHGQPLHFMEIAKLIDEQGFDHKKAHPATVHNELILRPEFVLVGRGIYGLKSWGYKTGIVTDVIAQLLRENGPLTRDEIVDELLNQRLVKKGTVILALSDKSKFKRLEDGRYDIVG